MKSVDEMQIHDTSNNNGSQMDEDEFRPVKNGASPSRTQYPLRSWKSTRDNPFEVLNSPAGAWKKKNKKNE